MYHYINNFEDIATGKVVLSVIVRVIDPLTTNQVPIYSDENGTPYTDLNGVVTNDARVNPKGRLDFWVIDGTYDLEITSAGTGRQIDYIRKINMVGDITPDMSNLLAQTVVAKNGAVAAAGDANDSAGQAMDAAARAEAASQYRVSIGYKIYAELAAIVGTAGQTAAVFDDVGTHTDPVVGGSVNNAGNYRYSLSPAGWERVSNLEATDAKTFRDEANAFADAAATSAASVNGPLLTNLTARLTADATYDYEPLYRLARGGGTSGFSVFRYAQLVPCSLSLDDIMPGVPVDRIGLITQMPAGWACLQVRVYERSMSSPNLNAWPPAAGDTLVYSATHTSAADFLDRYVSGSGTVVESFKLVVAQPWVGREGYGYVFERWFEDAGGTRLATFMGNNIGMPAGDPQYRSGWYGATAGGSYQNYPIGRALCLGVYSRKLTGPTIISDDRYSAPPVRELARRNSSALSMVTMLYPVNRSISMVGNSIVAQIANNTPPVLGRRTSDILKKIFPNCPVVNVGAGGATDAQVLAQINALTPAQKAGVICVSVGRGSYSQTTDNSAAIIADYDAIEALGLPYVVYCIDYSPTAYGSEEKELEIKIRELLKVKPYWGRVIDFPMLWQRYAANTVPDTDQLRRGQVIQSMMTDAEGDQVAAHLGPAAAVGWAYEWARMVIAIQGGVPYVRDQRFTYKASDPPGTAIGTIAVLGDWQVGGTIRIVAGNDDALFAVAEDTGVLSKGSKWRDPSWYPDFRELWVSVENGYGEHIARIVVGRQGEGTIPTPIRLRGDNAQLLGRPDGGLFANSQQFTLALYFRPKYAEDVPLAPRQVFGGLSGSAFASRNMGRQSQMGAIFDMFLTSTTGATNAMGNVAASTPRNAANGALYLFSVDAAAGIFRARTNYQPVVNASTTVANETIKLSDLQGILCGQPLDGFSLAGDISFVWADTSFHDPADDAVVARFVDASCKPISLGVDGSTPFGFSPRLCMFGSPDDWMRGVNRGTGGSFGPRFWTDRDLIGFSTPGAW